MDSPLGPLPSGAAWCVFFSPRMMFGDETVTVRVTSCRLSNQKCSNYNARCGASVNATIKPLTLSGSTSGLYVNPCHAYS